MGQTSNELKNSAPFKRRITKFHTDIHVELVYINARHDVISNFWSAFIESLSKCERITAFGRIFVVQHFASPTNWWASCSPYHRCFLIAFFFCPCSAVERTVWPHVQKSWRRQVFKSGLDHSTRNSTLHWSSWTTVELARRLLHPQSEFRKGFLFFSDSFS